jgi:hypothetical protein
MGEEGEMGLEDWIKRAYIAATDTGPSDPDENIVRVFDLGDRAVFELDLFDFFEDEGEVLCLSHSTRY